MIRRALFVVALACGALSAAAPALANNPHHEEADGCDHGATGKPCREDPSENGKDCEAHGKHGGINEDHCAQEVPASSTTTTTLPPTTTTTTSPVPPPLSVTTTTTAAPATPTPSTTTPAETQFSFSEPAPSAKSSLQPLAELPHTGRAADWLALLGLILAGAGVCFWAAGRLI